MYDIINPADVIFDNVDEVVVTNDRMKYAEYFTAIEKFSYENGGIITGKIAQQLLLGEPITKDSFMYEIYFDDASANAKKLVNMLYAIKHEFINNRYIYMENAYRGKEIKIFVDTRVIAVIYTPASYQKIPITKLMGTNEISGHFAKTVKVVPIEFLMIDVYRILYSPNNAPEWETTYVIEQRLHKLAEKSLDKNAIEIVEGGGARDECDVNKNQIVKILLSHIQNTDFILIGDFANDIGAKQGRLQLLSSSPIKDIVAEFTAAISQTKQIKLSSTYTIVTADIRIAKHGIIAQCKQRQIHICDIYTSATVEPIPYIEGKNEHKNIKIGNPYVLARFCLIDLWAMKLIINQSEMAGERGKTNWSILRIRQLLKNYKQIKKTIEGSKPTALFQTTDYIGVFEEPNKTKRRLFPGYSVWYYPAENK